MALSPNSSSSDTEVSTLRRYLKEISQYDTLDHDQERELARRIQEGDEEAFERMTARLEAHPEAMAQRRAIVEHPFGTLKCHIFGNGRLLLRGMKGAKAEMALGILAYNFRRAINLMTPRRMAAALG